jgi:predicted CxxxxCH...CXXCH cytochrome family protein
VTADNVCGSSTPQTLAVTVAADPPTITLGANPSVVEGSTTADLPYSATTNNPDQYSINYDATAEGEGFTDVTLAALPASPIELVVPGGAAPGTYNGTLSVRNSSSGLSSGDYAISVTITPGTPTITITDANPSVVQGTTTADVPYSGTTFNPDQYSIDYDATAEGEGFVDVTLASLPASPIVLTVPGAAALDTYNGILTVRNSSTGEVSTNYAITVTVTAAPSPPTITLGANPSVEEGSITADLPYSATTNSPDQYSIDYDATAEGEGFTDVTLAALPASPIVLVVPGAATPATYNATLTVTNSSTSLTSGDYAISVTITPGTPTITITDANPSVVQGTTTADVPYSATTFNPDQYSIDYDVTAEGQGFVDVTLAALPASPIVLTVPGAAAVDTYNGTLTVRNSGTGAVSGNYAITVTVTAAASPPTITLGVSPSVIEGSTSADLPYSATTNNPDQYSIDYDATAEGEGFVDVTLASLPASPIVLVVPGAAAPATYNATLTVTNSSTSLTSGDYAITVTITPGTPTITLTNPNPAVVQGTTSADLPYTATTFSPDQYSIDYDATAEGEGFADVSLAALPASPIVLTVPGAAAVDTYNGILTVRNSGTGAVSVNYPVTVTVSTDALPPTITLGESPTVCAGITTADLPYISTTESPDQYSIDYLTASETAGFVDVVNAALPASPIVLTVPDPIAEGTYYANLRVRNSTSGLSSNIYSISVTVITTPATPGLIFGSTTVPESTTGLSYAVIDVPGATSYSWTVPTGWDIEPDLGESATTTSSIIVTSGTAGQNGLITVIVNSTCGSSDQATLSVTSETPLDHSLYGCNACHITHNAPGGSLTNTFGNANLCLSCHVTNGAASSKPFVNADKADPLGGTGNSHAWDVLAINPTYETVIPTTYNEIAIRLPGDTDPEKTIICSACHDQHNANANLNYTRVSNAGDAMCKDCHSPRNVGRYVDDVNANKGSHPVGLDYTGTGDFEPTPTGSAILVGGKIECSSCHQTHYAPTNDGTLLRQANDDALCTSCHTYGTHNEMSCGDCHQSHNTNKDNIYMIRNTIATPNSGDRTVVFTSLTGNGSFADNDADGNSTWDGICEVCHTLPASSNHHNFEPADPTDNDHYSGQNCTTCHPHSSNFSPSGGGCTSCHEATPTYLSDVHQKHMATYGYACSTCHFGHGSGGASEGAHPSGTKDVVFDLNGMATRNGLDSNIPDTWAGTTCGNVYCHSDGRTADRGAEGVANWGFSNDPVSTTYQTTPDWATGSITACTACHGGPSTMPAAPDYTITEGSTTGQVTTTGEYPETGAHSVHINHPIS